MPTREATAMRSGHNVTREETPTAREKPTGSKEDLVQPKINNLKKKKKKNLSAK